jgi:hypothetical protein
MSTWHISGFCEQSEFLVVFHTPLHRTLSCISQFLYKCLPKVASPVSLGIQSVLPMKQYILFAEGFRNLNHGTLHLTLLRGNVTLLAFVGSYGAYSKLVGDSFEALRRAHKLRPDRFTRYNVPPLMQSSVGCFGDLLQCAMPRSRHDGKHIHRPRYRSSFFVCSVYPQRMQNEIPLCIFPQLIRDAKTSFTNP